MTTTTEIAPPPRRAGRRKYLIAGAALLVLAGIAWDTTVVRIGSEQDVAEAGFSPEAFGEETFPAVKDSVMSRAVEAATLAPAVMADKAAAAKQYGVAAGAGAVIPVKFTGVVGDGKSGIYNIAVDGLPPDVKIRLQTGPAINGTELRDATGEIKFGQFKNQIEYQNAGAALNNAMKQAVLAGVDTATLSGKTVSATGAFTLINPKNWLVTPVELAVQ